MRRILLLVAACCLMAGAAFANGLTGLVRDKDSLQPLIGADVALAGTDFKSATDLRGRFDIPEVPAGDSELRVEWKPGQDLRDAVAKAAVERDCGLLEMRPLALTFEDIYLKIISGGVEQ